MDIKAFWELVDKARETASGDARIQSDLLTEELAKLPGDEIISFDKIFHDLKDNAYIGNLWDAATIIMNGCGDDSFQEFREWLVGRGKEAYENAIQDPETLADVLRVGEQIYPTLLGPAFEAYEKVTGKTMPPMPRPWAELQGKSILNLDKEETELLAEISALFPRLTVNFWEWWLRDAIYLEIREILRKLLLPLGFKEQEGRLFAAIDFRREPFFVEWFFADDIPKPDYTLSVSSEWVDRRSPKTILIHFLPEEYNVEKKDALRNSLQGWLNSIKL